MFKKYQKFIMYIGLFLLLLLFVFALTTRIHVKENLNYHTKNHVALYLYQYNELPPNYVLKSEVIDDSVQPENGLYIGGDVHYYRGEITKYTINMSLRECDISYNPNESNRGLERLVYTSDCTEIFYTSDHYTSFSRVTMWSINSFSNISWILFIILLIFEVAISIYICNGKNEEKANYLVNLREVSKHIGIIIFTIIVIPFNVIYLVINEIIESIKRNQ